MKKVLLLSLGLVMGFGAYAQKPVVKAEMVKSQATLKKQTAVGTEVVNGTSNYSPKSAQSVVVNRYENFEEAETMWTHYDLQSNSLVSNRMYQSSNGSVAVTATMSHEEGQSANDRGTGYNFCANGDMGSWASMPEARVENIRTGWPSIAPYGANGEILVNHSDGLNFWIRETAGEGDWGEARQIPNPTNLEGQVNNFKLSWPRVATTGENNEIIHVFAAAQDSDNAGNVLATGQFYCRSIDGGNTWDVDWAPLFADEEHLDCYSADDCVVSTNGNTIAALYSGSLQHHVVLYKSTDNGETWERSIVWENPYYGCDWETDECSIYTDTMYGPGHASVAVGPDGVAHVALSSYVYTHAELGDTYSIWTGLTVDGIAYWNDEQETPITNPNGNPHDALRLWVDIGDGYVGHCENDSVRFCGWIAPDIEGGTYWNNYSYENFYSENDYFYTGLGKGASGWPSIAVDPAGNLIMAYSAPDMLRLYNGMYYYRTVYVSYKPAGQDKWNVAADQVFGDFIHLMDEGTSVSVVSTPVNVNEFWISCMSDDQPGFYWGNYATQPAATANTIYVFKISGEGMDIEETVAKDVVYNIYPNPASDYVRIASSMNADATIVFTNLAGQTVKVVNKNLTTGENSVSVNDLNSGVYFCTVTVNGYSHTTKVVVK